MPHSPPLTSLAPDQRGKEVSFSADVIGWSVEHFALLKLSARFALVLFPTFLELSLATILDKLKRGLYRYSYYLSTSLPFGTLSRVIFCCITYLFFSKHLACF